MEAGNPSLLDVPVGVALETARKASLLAARAASEVPDGRSMLTIALAAFHFSRGLRVDNTVGLAPPDPSRPPLAPLAAAAPPSRPDDPCRRARAKRWPRDSPLVSMLTLVAAVPVAAPEETRGPLLPARIQTSSAGGRDKIGSSTLGTLKSYLQIGGQKGCGWPREARTMISKQHYQVKDGDGGGK